MAEPQEGAAAPDPTDDRTLAERALRRGFVTADQLQDARRTVESHPSGAAPPRLRDILLERGYLTETRLRSLEDCPPPVPAAAPAQRPGAPFRKSDPPRPAARPVSPPAPSPAAAATCPRCGAAGAPTDLSPCAGCGFPAERAQGTDVVPPPSAQEVAALRQEPPSAPPTILSRGTRIGHYAIVREVGRGGMGIVYEAFQEDLKRRVALKILYPHLIADTSLVQRFRREAESAGRLTHPLIVRVHEFGTQGGLCYYTMDFLDGETLDRAMRRRSLTPTDVATIGLDTARALDAAHYQGIVHRDIKPSNLMRGKEGKTYLTDFGLARPADASPLTLSGAVVGTPAFMSPEQAGGGRSVVDHRSDLYSLGATLYALLSGRPPFQGEDMANMVRRVIDEAPPRLRSVAPQTPGPLAAIIEKAMDKVPERRYQSGSEMAADLQRFLQGQAVHAPQHGETVRLVGRLAEGHPVIATLVPVALFFLLLRLFTGGFSAPGPGPQNGPAGPTPASPDRTAHDEEMSRSLRRAQRDALRSQGILSIERQDYDRGIASLVQALELVPDDAALRTDCMRAWCLKGADELSHGRLETAREAFRQGQLVGPDAPEPRVGLADVLVAQDRATEAEAEYDAALRARPDLPDALAGSAEIRLRQKRLPDAADLLRRAQAAAPGNARVLVDLAFLAEEQGDHAAALDLADQGIRADSKSRSAYEARGVIHYHAREFDAARSDFELALQHDESAASTWMRLGEAYLALGAKSEARQALEHARQLDPKLPGLEERLAQAGR